MDQSPLRRTAQLRIVLQGDAIIGIINKGKTNRSLYLESVRLSCAAKCFGESGARRIQEPSPGETEKKEKRGLDAVREGLRWQDGDRTGSAI